MINLRFPRWIFALILLMGMMVQPLEAATDNPQKVNKTLETIEQTLTEAVDAVKQGKRDRAASLALDGFMTFEESSVHSALATRSGGLYGRLERNYMSFRSAVVDGESPEKLGERLAKIKTLHNEVRSALNVDSVSFWAIGLSSFMIIFREGLEALLVIAAMLAYLYKINEEQRSSALYWGTGMALLASFALAVGSNYLFSLSGAGRELLEGITMLVATIVLFYVSYWLISKIEAEKWKQFIESKIDRSVEAGSSFMLGTVGFIVVFREGFETVLFYQALGLSSGGSLMGGTGIIGGFLVGVVLLTIVGYIIIRSGKKIPLRPFFIVTSAFLYFLAFKFAGDGIVELQEAGVLSMETVRFIPDYGWLQSFFGIYPMWKPVLLQSILIVLLFGGLGFTFRDTLFRRLRPTRNK